MAISIIAEIGINHNGNLEIAKKLIDIAKFAGCDYVKFQKRDLNLLPEEQKNKIRDTIFGKMTYYEYKKMLEFNEEQYLEIDDYCKKLGIEWFFLFGTLIVQNLLKV